MEIYHEATGGFGFDIEPEEMQRLADYYSELFGRKCNADYPFTSEEYGGFLTLPEGFVYAAYEYPDSPRGFIVVIPDELMNSAMRGESEIPDMTPLLAWIDEHRIKVNSIPEIHYKVYVP